MLTPYLINIENTFGDNKHESAEIVDVSLGTFNTKIILHSTTNNEQ